MSSIYKILSFPSIFSTGMVGDIVSGKADMAVAGLTITGARSKVIDFSVPYKDATMGILVMPKIVQLKFYNFEFIAPLATQLQIALWIVVAGVVVLNFLYENNLYVLSLTSIKYKNTQYYPLYESMTYITGVTLQRDMGGKNPKRAGSRVNAIFFSFGMVIVVTTYTAILAAWSVKNQEKNPFRGSKDERVKAFCIFSLK